MLFLLHRIHYFLEVPIVERQLFLSHAFSSRIRLWRSCTSPLRIALIRERIEVVKWLLMKGALAPRDDNAGIDDMVVRRDLCQYSNWCDGRRLSLLSLARDAVATHDNSLILLLTETILSASSVRRRHPKY